MKYLKPLLCLLLLSNVLVAQSPNQEKMEQLHFLVGEWVGTSKIYENGVLTKEGAAYEHISYDLEKNILVIELNTEFLQLHTVILYDEKDQKYYYRTKTPGFSSVVPQRGVFENMANN